MPEQSATDCILSSIVTFLGGGLVGTILGHFLAIGRDARNRKHASKVAREARKTSFLAFLKVWEAEVDRNVRIYSPANVAVDIPGQFDAKRSELIYKATALGLDYQGKERASFQSFVKTITDMTAGAVGGEQGRQKLLEAIRSLTAWQERGSG